MQRSDCYNILQEVETLQIHVCNVGVGKTKEIYAAMKQLKCSCVIFDTELSPSQQKNLEIALNECTWCLNY